MVIQSFFVNNDFFYYTLGTVSFQADNSVATYLNFAGFLTKFELKGVP